MISIQGPGQHNDHVLQLPGSKYIANRLLILAALTPGQCVFENVPDNDDINTAQKGLSLLGAQFNRRDSHMTCHGINELKAAVGTSIYTSHSGTFSRFVVAVSALFNSEIALNGSDKMNSRPMADMLTALREGGVRIEATERETLPLQIKGPITADTIRISGAISSQYISALLLIAARLPQGLTIELTSEPVSRPYIAMTIDLLAQFGIEVSVSKDYREFVIAPGQHYTPINIHIPTDPSSASYFFAYAAISGTHLCLANYEPATSLQGEAKFTDVLEQMGCQVWQDDEGFHCQGPVQLRGVTVDMGDMPDVVQTLAVVAAFAEGETHITNIENLAFKESNRIEDTATELRKTGLGVETSSDTMTIKPAPISAATFDTYDDHRMAMSLGLLATRIEGIRMRNPEVVSKSFPDYWRYLAKLGFQTNDVE